MRRATKAILAGIIAGGIALSHCPTQRLEDLADLRVEKKVARRLEESVRPPIEEKIKEARKKRMEALSPFTGNERQAYVLLERLLGEGPAPQSPPVLMSLIAQESGFDPDAVSRTGAKGYFQVKDQTAREYGFDPERLYDPETNMTIGLMHLNDIEKRLEGGVDGQGERVTFSLEERAEYALLAHNLGPTALTALLESGWARENAEDFVDALRGAKQQGIKVTYWNRFKEKEEEVTPEKIDEIEQFYVGVMSGISEYGEKISLRGGAGAECRTLQEIADVGYKASVCSRGFLRGDLIVGEFTFPEFVEETTVRFTVRTDEGKTRTLTLPLTRKGAKAYALFGADFEYPSQTGILEVEMTGRSGGRRTERYEVPIRPRDFKVERFDSAEMQNAAPQSQADRESLAREHKELFPSWDKITGEPYFLNSVHPALRFSLPRPYCDYDSFGERRFYDDVEKSPHKGVDCKGGAAGNWVRAALSGKVALVGEEYFYMGNTVVLDHGLGLHTLYAHLEDYRVQEGRVVLKDDVLGHVGSTGRVTGPHLHWQAKLYGMDIDPTSLSVLSEIDE